MSKVMVTRGKYYAPEVKKTEVKNGIFCVPCFNTEQVKTFYQPHINVIP